jgi:hypothetical protein
VDPGPFFYTVITVYHLLALFTFLQNTIFYHSICLILSLQQTGEIDNLTVSWDKVLGYVVCRFHVAAGAKLRHGRGAIYKLSGAVAKLASINLQKLVLSPTGSINLGFILREDLLLCSSYLPLGVPNWADIYTPLPNLSYLSILSLFVSLSSPKPPDDFSSTTDNCTDEGGPAASPLPCIIVTEAVHCQGASI